MLSCPLSSGLSFLHELWDGPEGQRFGRGKLLHLQAVHTQEDRTEIRSQDCQQEVQTHILLSSDVFVNSDASGCVMFMLGSLFLSLSSFSAKSYTKHKIGMLS